ncbi:hypothetical protein Gpo141_00008461 [Globisporangium polare]
MLDDEARRALEEEAIALVSLSNPTTRFLDRSVGRTISSENRTINGSAESKALHYNTHYEHRQQQRQEQQGTNGGAIHPMLQVKANLIARRDGKMAGAPARKLRIKAGGDNPAAERSNDEQGKKSAAFLSMEVYVNGEAGSSADGNLQLASPSNRNNSSNPTKRAMSHAGGEELYAQNPAVSEEQQQLDALSGNISMKSLLVTLKKRKMSPHSDTDAAAAAAGESERAKVLPSFRDVFESPHQAALSQSQTSSSSGALNASPSSATATATPNAVLSSAELKCKYRTGKCSNVRALKSCGDYHNLCNYHRLRANANQRKLDRKKKVQRQQTTPGSAVSSPQAGTAPEGSMASTMSSSSSSSPASVSAATALCNPSAAAAAALVSMPTSAPPPAMLFHQQQRYEDAAAPLFAPQASAPVGSGSLEQQNNSSSSSSSSSSNSLRVKQEDRCM